MSFHLAGYFVSIGQTANTDVPVITDDVLPILNNHFVARQPFNLIAAYASSATLSRARLDSGTLRFYGQPYIRPINVGLLPANNPNQWLIWEKPFLLPQGEEIALQATSGLAMGNENAYGLIWLQDMFEPIPPGPVWPVRWTSTTTSVIQKWTTLTYTMETALPAFRFAMVYSEVQSAHIIAHRWIFDAPQLWRPGFLGITGLGNRNPYWEGLYRFGQMGQFINQSLPRVQVLTDTADSSFEGYMHIVPLTKLSSMSV